MSEISDAARMLRAGTATSAANHKLRESTFAWIRWFAGIVEHDDTVPGWSVHRAGTANDFNLKFPAKGGGTQEVNTWWNNQPMSRIHELCEALAGPAGKALVEWLERKTQERNGLAEGLDSMREQVPSR